jgi:transposase
MSDKHCIFVKKFAMIKYKVTLTKEEHEELMHIISKGTHTSQQFKTAYILLNCDEGELGEKITGRAICQVLKISERTIDRVKQRFVEEGFDASLERKPMSRTKQKMVDGELEAQLIAISCSEAPDGFAKWSLRLLADKMVEMKYIESISHETIRKVLKKTNLNRGKPKAG